MMINFGLWNMKHAAVVADNLGPQAYVLAQTRGNEEWRDVGVTSLASHPDAPLAPPASHLPTCFAKFTFSGTRMSPQRRSSIVCG